MSGTNLADEAAEKMTAALHAAEKKSGYLTEIVKAFGQTLVEQARWRAELPEVDAHDVSPLDPAKFAVGIPLSGREKLTRLGAVWEQAANRIMPSLAVGFPKIGSELQVIRTALAAGTFPADDFLGAAYGGRLEEAHEIAGQIGVEPKILLFVLVQTAKPVLEKRAQALRPHIAELAWNKGYCPICGSFPELSILRGKEGQRRLRCSFCANEWRFYRSACPCCEAQEPGHGEMIFVDGCEQEFVEVCHNCKTYITGIDTRKLAEEIVPEVMEINLLHLDAIAREKGFLALKEMEGPRSAG